MFINRLRWSTWLASAAAVIAYQAAIRLRSRLTGVYMSEYDLSECIQAFAIAVTFFVLAQWRKIKTQPVHYLGPSLVYGLMIFLGSVTTFLLDCFSASPARDRLKDHITTHFSLAYLVVAEADLLIHWPNVRRHYIPTLLAPIFNRRNILLLPWTLLLWVSLDHLVFRLYAFLLHGFSREPYEFYFISRPTSSIVILVTQTLVRGLLLCRPQRDLRAAAYILIEQININLPIAAWGRTFRNVRIRVWMLLEQITLPITVCRHTVRDELRRLWNRYQEFFVGEHRSTETNPSGTESASSRTNSRRASRKPSQKNSRTNSRKKPPRKR